MAPGGAAAAGGVPGDIAARNDERAGLLGLVRTLIAYGREMVASLQASNHPTPPTAIALRFGSMNLALIIARITRGLMLAAALEQRLQRPAPSVTQRANRAKPASPPATRRPKRPIPDERGELLGRLPSAREIAERIRNRRSGAVLVEICRDLGIDTRHPLWRRIRDAIIFHGGRMTNMLLVWRQCAADTATLPIWTEGSPGFEPMMAALTNPS